MSSLPTIYGEIWQSFYLPRLRYENSGGYSSPPEFHVELGNGGLEMSDHLIKKVCSNCKKPYNLADKLPLCPDCVVKLDGYQQVVEDSKLSSLFIPKKATDGPGFGTGA